jgi:hypothetical protein
MRDSFDILATTYPDQWNVQRLFFMACERSDKLYAVKLLAAVKEPPLPTLWGDNLPLHQSCKEWAEGRVPAFIMRDHDGDQVKEYLIQ